MSANLGQASLRCRRRERDAMRQYDALPTPLRRWVSEAHLPWSPTSALKLWRRAVERGLGIDGALDLLSRSESATLRRDQAAGLPPRTGRCLAEKRRGPGRAGGKRRPVSA